MTLRMNANSECIATFLDPGQNERLCPVCEQKGSIYYTRVKDRMRMCPECYKAWNLGKKEMLDHIGDLLKGHYDISVKVSMDDFIKSLLLEFKNLLPIEFRDEVETDGRSHNEKGS